MTMSGLICVTAGSFSHRLEFKHSSLTIHGSVLLQFAFVWN